MGRALRPGEGPSQDPLPHVAAIRPRLARMGRVNEPGEAGLLEPQHRSERSRIAHLSKRLM